MMKYPSDYFQQPRGSLNCLTVLMVFSFILFQGVLSPGLLLAHQGPLDLVGCHLNEKDEIYECHQGPFRGRIFMSQEEIQKASEEIDHPEKTPYAKVLSATDGDVILVLFLRSGDLRKVRLAEIDSPEKGQAFGRAARLSILEMAFGKLVQVNIKEIDPAGHMIAEVILSDGRSMNRELVRKGLSWWNSEDSDDTAMAELEAVARSKRIGLWQAANPVPPWQFNRNDPPAPQHRHAHCDRICA